MTLGQNVMKRSLILFISINCAEISNESWWYFVKARIDVVLFAEFDSLIVSVKFVCSCLNSSKDQDLHTTPGVSVFSVVMALPLMQLWH
jgi:hypothetical protein